MTRARIIFYSVFGAYQVLAFIFTVFIDNVQSMSSLLGLLKYIGVFKYITFLGVVLIAVDFIWLWREKRSTKLAEEASRHENNLLKAKVYDLQEGAKAKPEMPKAN